MQKPAVFLALSLVLAGASSVSAQLTEDYRFRGSTVDTKGNPIPGVEVVLKEEVSGRTMSFKSNKKGVFDRRMIPHGKYEATFSKPGYVGLVQPYDWSAATATVVEVESKIILQSEEEKQRVEVEQAKVELGKKESKLYEDAYKAFTADDCPTAEQHIQELLTLGTGTYEYAVHYLHARCLMKRGAEADAESSFRKVMALKPDFFPAHFDLAGLLEARGDHAEALKLYTSAASLKPEDAEVQYNIGAIHLKAGKFDQARPYLARTLELDGAHSAACKALALVHISGEPKDLKAALVLFQKYLELEPGASDAAQIQQMAKELERAR